MNFTGRWGPGRVAVERIPLQATGASTHAEARVDTPVTPSRSSARAPDDLGLIAACETAPTALEQLAGEWRELFERIGCSNVFLSAEWMTTWWRHFGGTQRLLLMSVRLPSGQLVAVTPFYVRRSFLGSWGPRALCFLANTRIGSDYLNALVDPDYREPAIQAIVRLVERQRTEWDYKVQWVNRVRRVQTVCFFDDRIKSQWAGAQVWVKSQAEQVKQLVRSSAAAEWTYAHAVRWWEQSKRLVRPPGHAHGWPVAHFFSAVVLLVCRGRRIR